MLFRLQFLGQVPETPEKDPDADGANGVLFKSINTKCSRSRSNTAAVDRRAAVLVHKLTNSQWCGDSFSSAPLLSKKKNQAVVFLFLQNKEFVCRGYDYERLEDFQQRMLGEFPQAIAMQHPNQPDDTILQSDAQCILLSSQQITLEWDRDQTFVLSISFKHPSCSSSVNSCLFFHLLVTSLTLWLLDLQIYAVTPVSDISDVPQLERVPERIKSFYRINNVSRFHYDRPFHKGPKDRENEFRVRWASSATQSVSASVSFTKPEIWNLLWGTIYAT